MSEPTRRLFFALWPDDTLRRQIEHETRAAARHSGGRVIPAANLHITLAFLGSVPESRVAIALQCAAQIDVTPFELVLDRLNWWPKQELLCLEPSAGAAELANLVTDLHATLRAHEFAIEPRPFRAHITLARDVRREHALRPIRALHWPVERFDLIESRTGPRGSVYSVLPT